MSTSLRIAALAALSLLLAPPPAVAQERVLPRDRAELQLSFAPLVRQAAPAVVNIYTRRVVQAQRSPLFDDPFFRRFFGADPDLGAAPRRTMQSLGSGVIVDPSGLIVTSHHVVEGAEEITVALADRREFEAELALADARNDLALLRIRGGGARLPYLELRDSDDIEVGDLVIAIGNPFGVGQTVTTGIVSALGRSISGAPGLQSFIQTDAAINPGNSGGALVTMDGRLVGINTAIFSRSGGSHGIGFAIPSGLVESLLRGAEEGVIRRPWLGAGGQAVTADIAAGLGLDRPGGVLVNSLWPNGAADRAGLRIGDVVLAVDGRPVHDPEALRFHIATGGLGDTAELEVRRQGRLLRLTLPLEPPPEDPPRELTQLRGPHPLSGATVGNLSPAFAEELGLEGVPAGIIVTEVAGGSAAQRMGLRPRDMVLSVNGEEVARVGALERALRADGGTWRISLRRGERVLNLVVRR